MDDEGLKELERMAGKETDPAFTEFESILAEEPEQVIFMCTSGVRLFFLCFS